MKEAYRLTRKDGAPGIDGVTAADYATNLEELLLQPRGRQGGNERTKYRFDVELGNRGMWYATSPDVKGLLVARTGQYCREGPAARSAWLKQHTAPTILTPPSLDAERHPERLQYSVR
jgi:hypothetical protein